MGENDPIWEAKGAYIFGPDEKPLLILCTRVYRGERVLVVHTPQILTDKMTLALKQEILRVIDADLSISLARKQQKGG